MICPVDRTKTALTQWRKSSILKTGHMPDKNYLIGPAGPNQRQLTLPDYYDAIKTQLGLTDAPADSTVSTDSISELKQKGLAVVLRTTRLVSAGPPKISKSKLVVCSIANVASAISSLRGQTFAPGPTGGTNISGEIKRVGLPRKRTRS